MKEMKEMKDGIIHLEEKLRLEKGNYLITKVYETLPIPDNQLRMYDYTNKQHWWSKELPYFPNVKEQERINYIKVIL
jgi:hypothetical protein